MSGTVLPRLRGLPRPARFLLAGGTAAAVNWLVRFPLSTVMPFVPAVLLAAAIGMLVGFVLYRHVVFTGSTRPLMHQLRDFLVVNLATMVVVALLSAGLLSLALRLDIALGAAEAGAHALAIGFGAVLNYAGHSLATFAPRSGLRDAVPMGRGGMALAFILLLLLLLYPPLLQWRTSDAEWWFAPWVEHILLHGTQASLAAPMRIAVDGADGFANYAPPYLYLLSLSTAASAWLSAFQLVKLVALAGALFCAFCIWHLLRAVAAPRTALLAAAASLLLPSVMLNGAAWGQTDTIWAGLAALVVSFALRGQWAAMMLAFGAALAFKLQAILIAPFLLHVVLSRRLGLQYLPLPLLAYAAMMLPAWIAGRPAWELATVYLEQAGTYRWLSMNAPNPWAFVQYGRLLTYEAGVLLGTAITVLAALALSVLTLRWRRLQGADLLLLAVTVAASMPYLLPKMHDRYFFLADILAYALAVCRPNRGTIAAALLIQMGSVAAYASHLLDLAPAKYGGALLIGLALLILLRQLAAALGLRRAAGSVLA